MHSFYFFASLYFAGMLFVFLYSLAQGHLLFHFLKALKKQNQASSTEIKTLPKVTVQLPIYNEQYVVERLIDAAAQLNYPRELLEIQILDDSTDQTVDLIQNKLKQYPQLNFTYLHRVDRVGYKAGALREGLASAHGEFIAIFDADFVPDPQFLLKTLPYFSSPDIGMVQTRWTHLNRPYSMLTQLQAFALDAHFFVEQLGRNHQGAFINFNGTAGIWRKSCILDAGNWQDDTLTEDLDLSYRAQRKGWKFVYRPEVESPAELPPILSAVKSQQFRWNKGGAECAVKHIRQVLREPHGWRVKLHALAHLFNSTVFVAIFLSSLSSIGLTWLLREERTYTYFPIIAGLSMLGFVMVAGVYMMAYLQAQGFSWTSFTNVIWKLPLFLCVSMGLSLHNTQAVLEGLTGKKSPFIRTPKFNLEANLVPLHSNVYRWRALPVSTWMEGILFMVFAGMLVFGLIQGSYVFLPLHGILCLGFGLVFLYSFQSR